MKVGACINGCTVSIAVAVMMPVAGATGSQAAPDDSVLERAKAKLTKEIGEILADTGIPSISIALFDGDSVVWSEAFGYSNMKLKVPASPNTIYGTGSCLKPVTAMAVLQLADRGKLKLDDPINNYLGDRSISDLSSEGKPVTFRHLLSHYSGLTVRYAMLPLWERRLPKSLEELAAELKAEQPPGRHYQYSNSGFALAGLLVKKVSVQSFEDYLVDHILKPLGITISGPINPTPEMIEELALPYRLEQNKPVPEAPHRFDVYPAGDAYLSVPDMAKILLVHLNDRKYREVSILSAAAVEEMRRPQFGGGSGLDFGIRMFEEETLIMHGGGVPGFSTKLILNVNSRIGVYVVANAGGAQTAMNILAQLAIDLLRGNKVGDGLVRKIVGVGTSLAVDEETGMLRITGVIPKSPAIRAGLTGGLTILSIDWVSATGIGIEKCLRMIGGAAGTDVTLNITDSEQSNARRVELIRDEFLVPG